MDTKANQATESNQTTDKGAKPVPNLILQNKLEEGLKAYGKTTFLKAVKTASEGLLGVMENESVIRARQQGNAAILYKLAKECVKLTTEGDTVNLESAATLMRQACEYTEETFMMDYRKKNPDSLSDDDLGKANIRKVSPSWVTLRSDAVKALETKQINPADYKNYSAMNEAYKLYKQQQNGTAGGGEQRGAQTPGEAGGTSGTATAGEAMKSVKVSAKTAETANTIAKLSDHVRGSLALLVHTCQSVPTKLQVDAASLIDKCIREIEALAAKAGGTDEPKTTKVHKPAATPDSNRVAS